MTHRYTLQPYTGPKSRTICPGCGKPRCFTRYVDTDTGELLPDAYGRCNHEVKCGYSVSPYQTEADGLSYKERVYQEGKRAGIAAPSRTRRPLRVSAPVAPLPGIPGEVFRASQARYKDNQFARLLCEHFGAGLADELLARFHVGTSAFWPGACVFWLVDEQGRTRGGQVKLFDETFHTVPGKISWVHTALRVGYTRKGQPCPEWLTAYEKGPKSPCLFGLPQLLTDSLNKPVAIVEAPKTAIVMSGYCPDFLWLATMGKSYLNAERLASVKGRKITLFPDASAEGKTFGEWQRKAAELNSEGFSILLSETLEQTATPEQKAEGADLADILLTEWPGYPPSWDSVA